MVRAVKTLHFLHATINKLRGSEIIAGYYYNMTHKIDIYS